MSRLKMGKANASPTALSSPDLLKLKYYLINTLSRELDGSDLTPEERKKFAIERLEDIYKRANVNLPDDMRKRMFREVGNEIFGFGPIEKLLNDSSVTEVMVNGPKSVYVERNGKLIKTPVKFEDNDHVRSIIERIIAPLGRRIDEDSPTVDARLPDGSRVNAIIPPVAIDGPSITIRKFAEDKLGVTDLINFGSMTEGMAEFLRACVAARLNIVISGGTGSGKTTLLNVLSSFIGGDERIVTLEDAAELQLQQDHVVRLETKPPNADGEGGVSIRELVKNSLRMRPDRIIVGEVRGGEALDMLQAMNTGHDGSLATVHSNSPRDAIARLATLVLMAGMDLPIDVVNKQIASAVDLIVQQTRLKDGSRKVVAVSEVAGMEGDTVILSDIFKFKQEGIRDGKIIGRTEPTGLRPMFASKLEDAGFNLGAGVFGGNVADILSSNRDRKRRRR